MFKCRYFKSSIYLFSSIAVNINGVEHTIACALIICNELESLLGYGLHTDENGTTILHGNRFFFIAALFVKDDGTILTMPIDMVPFINDTRDAAKKQARDRIRWTAEILNRMGIKVAGYSRDKGSNPKAVGIGIDEITCVLHNLKCLVKALFHCRTITIDNVRINLGDLKREFSGENLVGDEKEYVEEFWSVVYHPRRSFNFSAFRNSCGFNFFNRMRNFLPNLNWNVNRDLMRQFVKFLDLLVNIENLHGLLHTPMSDEVAVGMQQIIDYLQTLIVRVIMDPIQPLCVCLRFFILAYRRSRVPFVSAFFSILVIYLIKGFIVFVLNNGVMPSIQKYIDILSTVEGEIQGQSIYGNHIVNLVRVAGLSDIFLRRNVMPLDVFPEINPNLVIHMQQLEDLQDEEEENVADALMYATSAVNKCFRLPQGIAIMELIRIVCRLLSLQNVIRRHN